MLRVYVVEIRMTFAGGRLESHPLKVLVVEDIAGVREVFAEGIRLLFEGAVVDEAADGREAQKKLQTNTYHVVVSDLEMPRLAGDELLSWIRATPPHTDVPFVMVTANNDMFERSRLLSLGASAYVTKPFTIQELSRHIAAVLPQHISRKYEDMKKGDVSL